MDFDFSEKKYVRIGKNVSINADHIEFGDCVFIGDNVTIDVPHLVIGDYTMFRENTQILGKKECRVGMNCWIGQGCILNATDNLTLGNGVGIGAHSQLWTHMRFGDVVQGCRWESTKPLVVEDDVWFVGHCLVSPIHAKARSMAMLGSLITKDMEENHIYAGVPAKDLTDKMGGQFKKVTVDEKFAAMQKLLDEFSETNKTDGKIKIVKDWSEATDESVTYFNVSTREYTKRLSDIEIDFMLYLLVLVKFYPKQ